MQFKVSNYGQPLKASVVEGRIARPTDNLEEIKKFYREGLELPVIGSFEKHNGYSGIMFGLPGNDYHIEFTHHEHGSPCPSQTKDNLLVFYIPDINELEKLAERIFSLGYNFVDPENSYWKEKGITIEDPDGWRIVLMNTKGI